MTIDNRTLEVPAGTTILEAAHALGITIPTMCHGRGLTAQTSCMVCVVKVTGMDQLTPACGTVVQDGMQVITDDGQIREARKTALELLLSDHAGDCMGPCQVACPAHMNIPLMIRQIRDGDFAQAFATAKADIALPAVLGRICPAPCEKVCRRGGYDAPVSICLLRRFVADMDLQRVVRPLPEVPQTSDKRVAVVGAGPAGLAAAYYLQLAGFDCVLFDDHALPGGMLRYGVPDSELSKEVLDAEIQTILGLGVAFQGNTRIGRALTVEQLREQFGVIFIGVGACAPAQLEALGFTLDTEKDLVNPRTYQTRLPGVFAGGDVFRKRRWAVRAVADGKEAAVSMAQFLRGQEVTGPQRPFNTRLGSIDDHALQQWAQQAGPEARVTPSSAGSGLTQEQAPKEAGRCLHCDCRKADVCRLRQYAAVYEARAARFQGQCRPFSQIRGHARVIYEPGKCINCGLCVQITGADKERLGLSFVGRGFNVRVQVPFDKALAEGLEKTAAKVVQACPTGALAFKDSSAEEERRR